MHLPKLAARLTSLILLIIELPYAYAQIEEITVSARQREEVLKDVPVTVSVIDQQALELFQLSSIRDISGLVPGLFTTQRGSGSAAVLYLRGIGSNTNDAAFDSAVALNFDGVVANSSRLITNGNLDMTQIEILKGPQSLYFGKGASAGVISIRSADPTQETQGHLRLLREFEESSLGLEGVVSGALTDTVSARLALRVSDADEVVRNSDPNARNQWRGEEHKDGRLTIAWAPQGNFNANLKYSFSEYSNDGALLFADIQCRGNAAQDTIYGFQQIVLPNNYNCDFTDQQIQVADQNLFEGQQQLGNNGGVPYSEQTLDLARLKMDWDISEQYRITSITAYLDMAEQGFDCFAYDQHGSSCVVTANDEQSFSQELRIQSSFDGAFNFTAGLFYQDRDLFHLNRQNTFGVPFLLGAADLFMSNQGAAAALDRYNFNIVPPFPVFDPTSATGNSFDWTKEHPTNHKTYSVFASISWDITEKLGLTLGGRYSDERKNNIYSIPYIHSAYIALSAPPFNVPSAPGGFSVATSFSDSNFTPEASLSYAADDQTTFYAAYKTGFKSGGISTSQLPLFTTYLSLSAGDTSELIYQSETSSGFEIGVRAKRFDDRLGLNATLYRYIYEDLQIQNFDSGALAFVTLNADEVTNQGVETDFVYQTHIDGLLIRGRLAYTDTEYTESFFNILGIDLNGKKRQQAPEWAGSIGVDYDLNLGSSLTSGISLTANYSDSYLTNNSETGGPDDYIQPSFWRVDIGLYISDEAGSWELSLAAKNLADKIYSVDTVGRPNSIPNANGERDLVHFQNRGRQLSLTASYNF